MLAKLKLTCQSATLPRRSARRLRTIAYTRHEFQLSFKLIGQLIPNSSSSIFSFDRCHFHVWWTARTIEHLFKFLSREEHFFNPPELNPSPLFWAKECAWFMNLWFISVITQLDVTSTIWNWRSTNNSDSSRLNEVRENGNCIVDVEEMKTAHDTLLASCIQPSRGFHSIPVIPQCDAKRCKDTVTIQLDSELNS